MNVMCYFLLLTVCNSQRVIQQENVYGASKSSLQQQGEKQCFERRGGGEEQKLLSALSI